MAFSLLICTYRKYINHIPPKLTVAHNSFENFTYLKMKPTLMKTKLVHYLPKNIVSILNVTKFVQTILKTSTCCIVIMNVENKVFNSTSKQLSQTKLAKLILVSSK